MLPSSNVKFRTVADGTINGSGKGIGALIIIGSCMTDGCVIGFGLGMGIVLCINPNLFPDDTVMSPFHYTFNVGRFILLPD
jgi:hypothetical protein